MKKVVIVLAFLATSIFSENQFLDGIFINPVSRYFDMEIDANNNNYNVEDAFTTDIIEILSGMIYGWEFIYIPSDIKREIEEEFTLKPIAIINKDDPNIEYRSNWVKEFIMYQNLIYRLSDHQKRRLKSWNTALIPDSYGEGEASIHIEGGKSESLHNALKDSIKREFQSRGKDKPRRILGQILIKETPRQFINSGNFKTQVEVFILYKKVNEYKYQ